MQRFVLIGKRFYMAFSVHWRVKVVFAGTPAQQIVHLSNTERGLDTQNLDCNSGTVFSFEPYQMSGGTGVSESLLCPTKRGDVQNSNVSGIAPLIN